MRIINRLRFFEILWIKIYIFKAILFANRILKKNNVYFSSFYGVFEIEMKKLVIFSPKKKCAGKNKSFPKPEREAS